MSQVTNWTVTNGGGSAVRAAINTILAAGQSCSSGPSAPSPTVGGMFWHDTSALALKVRNTANTAWIIVVSETVPANSLQGNPTASAAPAQSVTMAQLKAMLGFSQSIAPSGYQILPTGLIVQWGGGASGAAGSTVTFPTTFPNACYGAYGNHDGIVDVNIVVNSITATGFYVRAFNQAGGLLNANYKFFAIGN